MCVFAAKGKLADKLQMWWFPPQVDHSAAPVADHYHLRRLFLQMPRKMWKIDFQCPRCKKSLTSKGLHNYVCLVLDIKDYYYLAAEYLECRACKGTFIAWDHQMLGQLADGVRSRFPVILMYKYACDKAFFMDVCWETAQLLFNTLFMRHTVVTRWIDISSSCLTVRGTLLACCHLFKLFPCLTNQLPSSACLQCGGFLPYMCVMCSQDFLSFLHLSPQCI